MKEGYGVAIINQVRLENLKFKRFWGLKLIFGGKMELTNITIFILAFCLWLAILYIIYLKNRLERKERFINKMIEDLLFQTFKNDYYDNKYDNEFDKNNKIELEDILNVIKTTEFKVINKRTKK